MRISDWSSDVCSSDLAGPGEGASLRHDSSLLLAIAWDVAQNWQGRDEGASADRNGFVVGQQHDNRGGAFTLQWVVQASRAVICISALQAAHEINRHRRHRVYRISQFRHAQPVYQSGIAAEDRGLRLRSVDA